MLSLVAASGGHSLSRCAGLSSSRPLLLRSTGSRRAGSVIVAHGPSCTAACGILPDQGSNPRPLHRQADSQPLCHQGSPPWDFLIPALGLSFSAGVSPSQPFSSSRCLEFTTSSSTSCLTVLAWAFASPWSWDWVPSR